MKIRNDLIEKELHSSGTDGLTFRRLKPSNKFIDWLFRHYFVRELTEHFYDSEPDYDDEEFNMYMDYLYIHKQIEPSGVSFFNTILNLEEIQEKQEDFRYSKEPHTFEELETAYKNVLKQREEYEEHRLNFNNWIEPYFAGNWGMTQNTVDKIARRIIKSVKRAPVSYNGRLFISEKDGYIYIYYFGRDYNQADYWFVMQRKNLRIKSEKVLTNPKKHDIMSNVR